MFRSGFCLLFFASVASISEKYSPICACFFFELQGVIFNPLLYNTRRTYIMCPTTIVIGLVDPSTGNPLPVGGDLQLTVINPNVEIKCLEPGTCILQGGASQLTTLDDTALIAAFLAADPNNPPLPESYFPDASELIVDGMTFTGSGDLLEAFAESNLELLASGQNMTVVGCTFTNQNIDLPPQSGVNLVRQRDNYPEGKEFYATLTMKGCTFSNNIYKSAVIRSTTNAAFGPPTFHLTIEDTIIADTVIEGRANSILTSIISLIQTSGSITDTTIVSSRSGRSPGTISLIDSDVTFENVVLIENGIDINVTECEDVSIGSVLNATETTLFISFDSCLELEDPQAPVIAPTTPPVSTMQPVGEPSASSSKSKKMGGKKKKRTRRTLASQSAAGIRGATKSMPRAGAVRGSF
jgi:hypothetical protein